MTKRTTESADVKVVRRKNSNRTDVYVRVECPQCKETRWIKKSHLKDAKYTGVCTKCNSKATAGLRTPQIPATCKICGKAFFHIKSRNPKYCSWECCWEDKKGIWPSERVMLGKTHWNYQGGITNKDAIERNRFRGQMNKKIFNRDNFTCVSCGTKGKYLQVHHIKPWADYPELRFEESNCQTLCMGCHYEVHFGRALEVGVVWGRLKKEFI